MWSHPNNYHYPDGMPELRPLTNYDSMPELMTFSDGASTMRSHLQVPRMRFFTESGCADSKDEAQTGGSVTQDIDGASDTPSARS
jgi:hypothetical protein